MIVDPTELTPFSDYAGTGIITTDTFNDWRKKDNGLVQQFNLFASNSAATGISFDNATATISIKTGGVITANLADSAVTGDKIANLTITEGKLAANSVTESKIGAGAVTEAKIGSAAVTEAKIGTGAVTSFKLGNLAVIDTKIASSAVTADKIAINAVTREKIVDLAVNHAKLADGAVTAAKMGENAINTAQIVNLAVTVDKLAAGAVTESKIALNAITTDKIVNQGVTTAKISNTSITAAKLSGAQGGDAPIFAPRAYVVFKANTAANLSGSFSRTSGGTTVTGMSGHALLVGHRVWFSGVSGGSFTQGVWEVTEVISNSSFVINHTGSATSGTLSARFFSILRAGNVSNVSRYADNRAQFIVNFTDPLPTIDYAVIGSTRWYDWVFDDEDTGRQNTVKQAYLRTYYNDNPKVSVSFLG